MSVLFVCSPIKSSFVPMFASDAFVIPFQYMRSDHQTLLDAVLALPFIIIYNVIILW